MCYEMAVLLMLVCCLNLLFVSLGVVVYCMIVEGTVAQGRGGWVYLYSKAKYVSRSITDTALLRPCCSALKITAPSQPGIRNLVRMLG